MNVLITGISGFVGSNLVANLGEQYRIYGVDIVNVEDKKVIKTFGWDEISDNGDIQFDAVIHLAGKAHDLKNSCDPQEYFDINTGLTKKIFDLFLESTAKKFIHFSSVKAAADFMQDEALTEDITPCPVGPYGESKIVAENYITETLAARPDMAENRQVYILRPCMIHGPGNKGNLNLLYSVVKRGIPWPLGAYENQRSFTSIGNLVFIIDRLLSGNVPTGIYNVGDDMALSTNDLVGAICEGLGKKGRIWNTPKPLVKFIAGIGDFLPIPLNTDRLNKLTENYVISNRKIKEALGVDNLPIEAREGIIQTIHSFKN
ncbi:MAG: NAD-dependent epimerase/dehydratase family protein [Alistipes sp.]|nr:NAD-dependent epimerase/dehydratase family protein [Alistipes sp.]